VSNGEEKGGAQAGGKSNADFKRMFLGEGTQDDNNTATAPAGATDGGSGGGDGAQDVDGQDVDMTSEGNGSKTD
jgi:hypothetical protein